MEPWRALMHGANESAGITTESGLGPISRILSVSAGSGCETQEISGARSVSQFTWYCNLRLHTVLLQTNISELVKLLMFSVGHRMHTNELVILHPAGCSMRLLIERSIDPYQEAKSFNLGSTERHPVYLYTSPHLSLRRTSITARQG